MVKDEIASFVLPISKNSVAEEMAEQENVVTTVAQGHLRGRKVASRAGGVFFSFQGVPYAKPPLGPLRFKDAEPPEPWSGIRDALIEGPNCTQLNLESRSYVGSEDCLYLNVYTPYVPGPGEKTRLPVMVWIHGGGFTSGSGHSANYGGDFLVTEGAVVITINYRLGPLGFLFLDHEAAPGNAGLKDQVAALRWVKQNIAAFGGDPEKVTIFGESAGGASVQFHMLSPMSKGLFHRAIAQSGSILNPWAQQWKPEETTRRLAKALGCTSDDPQKIVDFLREVDHTELVKKANTDAPLPKNKERIVVFSFVPTPEKVVPGVETFLPKSAKELLDEGAHHAVPYLTGFNTNESIFMLFFKDFREPETAADLDGKWDKIVLPELRLTENGTNATAALEELRQFFMGGKPLSQHTLPGFMDMFTDVTFAEGIEYTIRKMAKDAKAPIYYYSFSMDGDLNFLKKVWKANHTGACHADEIGYLFRTMANDPDLPEDNAAALTRRRMVRMWVNFARSGDPTPTQDPLLPVKWKPYTTQELNYVDIGSEIIASTDFCKKREDFWKTFYNKYR